MKRIINKQQKKNDNKQFMENFYYIQRGEHAPRQGAASQ